MLEALGLYLRKIMMGDFQPGGRSVTKKYQNGSNQNGANHVRWSYKVENQHLHIHNDDGRGRNCRREIRSCQGGWLW
jgi:hypothetical protein